MALHDYQFKEADLMEEDDELAHLDLDQPKILQYVGGDKDSLPKFKGKILPEGEGVTYQLLNPEEEEGQGGDGESAEMGEEEEEEDINYIYIPDVVTDQRIYFFDIPRLGSYMAVPIFLKSYLNAMAFDDALVKIREWKEREIELQEFKKDKEEEFEDRIIQAKEADEDYQEIVEELENYEWEPNPEPEILSEEKLYVFCCDTLGRDQEISQEDRDYIAKICRLFATSWENKELEYLKGDVERYLAFEEDVNIPDLLDEWYNEEDMKESAVQGEIGGLTEEEQSYRIKAEQ